MTAPALQHPAPAAGRVADAALWFGIFGAPVMEPQGKRAAKMSPIAMLGSSFARTWLTI